MHRHSGLLPLKKAVSCSPATQSVVVHAMSAALNSRPDASINNNSAGDIPDLSLSIGSAISTPAKLSLRVPSASSATSAPSSALLSTPSPPVANGAFARRKTDVGLRRADQEGEEDADFLNTPANGRWDDGIDTPVATRVKRPRSSVAGTGTKGANLTLRDQEKVITTKLIHISILMPV